MITNFFRKINLPLLGRGLGGGLLLLIAAPVFAQYNLSLCEGQGFMLTSDAAGPEDLGPITYKWYDVSDPAASFTVGTNAATLMMPASSVTAGTYAYVCEVANSACTLSTSSYTVQVVAAPAAPVITAPAEICQNGALTFWVDSPLTSNATYTWTASAGTQNGSSWTFDTSTDGAKTATVSVQVPAGDITCQSNDAQTVTATVVALPATPVLQQDGPKCEGSYVTFTATCSGTCEWSGYFSGTGTQKTSPTTAGDYTAVVRSVTTNGETYCYSEAASLTGTVKAGGGFRSPVNECGCRSSYINCSGLCRLSCYTNSGSCPCGTTSVGNKVDSANACKTYCDSYTIYQYGTTCPNGVWNCYCCGGIR
jgi:hypothetical protein